MATRKTRITDLFSPAQIAEMDAEFAQAALDLVVILSGGQIDDRPVHPLTGERMNYPLSKDDMAAINHSQLAKWRPQDIDALQCNCDFCRRWRRERRRGRV